MAKSQDEVLSQLQKQFRKLRSVSDYDAYLITLACGLGLPNSTSPIAMKALIIRATKDTFPDTINADMVLVALGLLQGYNNQYGAETGKVARNRLTERRKMFLQESSYKPTDIISNDTGKTILSTLGSTDGRSIDLVVENLYETPSLNAYLQKSINDYGVFNDDQLIDVKLPVLRYPRTVNITTTNEDAATQPTPETAKTADSVPSQETEQAESSDTALETEQETKQTETVGTKVAADQDTAIPAPDPDSRSQPDTQQPPDPAPQSPPTPIPVTVTENTVQQNAFLVRALGVVSIIAVVCLAFVFIWQSLTQRVAYNSLSDTMALPEIESISFAELDEPPTLAPGESLVLKLEIEPKVYLPEDLDYYSDKVWAAYTNKNEVIANPELASTVDEVVAITAQKGPIEDTINVLVRGTDAAGAGGIGNGANGPDSSMEGGE